MKKKRATPTTEITPKNLNQNTTITHFQQETVDALYVSVRANLLSGVVVLPHRYPKDQQAALAGVIAKLRDELPIKAGWKTVWESHLSETRLRARRYKIDGAFLREVDNG